MQRKTIGICLLLLSIMSMSCRFEKPKSDAAETEEIAFPVVSFTIAANSDTTLFGPQGTRLFIERNTFQYPDGTAVNDSIKIELKEFYKKSDISLADLSTESNGRLLETAGMLHIAAFAGNQPLTIKEDKRLVIHFPKMENNTIDMNLFFADKTSNATSVSNWNIDTVNLVKSTLKIGSYAWYGPSFDDSTKYDFMPMHFTDTGYYMNPLDLYINAFNFSTETKREIETHLNKTSYSTLTPWNDYGVECEMSITEDGYIKNPRINSNISLRAKREILRFLSNLPQLEPGKDKYGKITERSGLLFIQGGNIVPLYKTREEYLKSFNSKYARFENQPIRNMNDAELNYYIFSVANLGWINCDRFIEFEKKEDFIVQIPFDKNTKIKMIFKDISGVLIAKPTDEKYVFANVPSGKKVTILAINNNNGKLRTAFTETSVSGKPLENLVLKETTLKDLKQQLEKLN